MKGVDEMFKGAMRAAMYELEGARKKVKKSTESKVTMDDQTRVCL